MFGQIVCISAVVAISFAQKTCSSTLMPSVANLCPPDFEFQANGCCPYQNVIELAKRGCSGPTYSSIDGVCQTGMEYQGSNRCCPFQNVIELAKRGCSGRTYSSIDGVCMTGMEFQGSNRCCPYENVIASFSDLCPPGFEFQGNNNCCPNENVIACADKLNPSTGRSDCPGMAAYCQIAAYRNLMQDHCPKTCGFCGGSGIPPSSCVDKLNPNTGRSDCPGMAAYCTNAAYFTLMRDQCPKTCYTTFAAEQQFSLAEQTCIGIGGHLVSLHNAFENSIVTDNANSVLVSSNSTNFWIGASDLVNKGQWQWTDGNAFDYNNWLNGQPVVTADCVSSGRSSGQWSSIDCFQYRPFVCASPPMAATTCPPPPTCPTLLCPTASCTQRPCVPHCPSEWTYYAETDACYRAFFHAKWSDAEDFCVQQNSHLASIHSSAENTFVNRLTTTQLTQDDTADLTWIGLYVKGNSWVWTDGTKLDYINWAPKQPDNPGKENCVQTAQDKSHDGWFENWNNENCDTMMRAYVCKTVSIRQ